MSLLIKTTVYRIVDVRNPLLKHRHTNVLTGIVVAHGGMLPLKNFFVKREERIFTMMMSTVLLIACM